MGTVVDVWARGRISAALPDALAQLLAYQERLWSRFIEDSDVSRVNRAAGQWVTVAPLTAELLDAALAYAATSGGAFTPVIGRLARLWSVKRWAAAIANGQDPQLPSDDVVMRARQQCDPQLLQKRGACEYRVRGGALLNLDGVAKGAAADQLRDLCVARGVDSALVSVGTSSISSTDDSWRVGISDLNHEGVATTVRFRGALSTSGDYLQRLPQLVHGQMVHHVIDPRAGCPSDSGVRQASVICDSGIRAEVASTALLVTGEPNRELLRGARWLTLDQQGQVHSSSAV